MTLLARLFARLSPWLPALGLLALVISLSLRLSATWLVPLLNSDHLYPHIFVKDWLYGPYPIDAWRFGSATFLFPDYPLYALLLSSGLSDSTAFTRYAALQMSLLGIVLALLFRQLTRLAMHQSAIWGLGTLAILLSLQFLPGHGPMLYWLLLPGFHGSSLTMGLLWIAIWLPRLGQAQSLKMPGWFGLTTLGLLAFYANTLFFTQFVLPLGLAGALLFRQQWCQRGSPLRQYGGTLLVLLAGRVAINKALQALDIWEHARVFRHFPSPQEIWATLQRFGHDWVTQLWPNQFAFWTLTFFALPLLVYLSCRTSTRATNQTNPLPLWSCFVLLSLSCAVALPIVALYWQNSSNARYFLNLLILPAVSLALLLAQRLSQTALKTYTAIRGIQLGSTLAILGLAFALRPEQLARFPYPDAVAEYDALLKQYGLQRGLSDYWHSHLFNELSRGEAHLNHLEPQGNAYFWCNNIHWYFGPPTDEPPAANTAYDFILLNGLEPEAIRLRYGAPVQVITGQYLTLYLYDPQTNWTAPLQEEIQNWYAER